MTTHRSPTFAVAALTAASLLLAACSSGAANNTGPSAAHANPSPHTAAPTVAAGATAAPTSSASTTAAAAVEATPSVAATTAASACTLVSEAEISTALGGDPGPGSKFASHGSSQCQYGSYQTKFVLVNLTPTRGRAGYDLMHNGSKLRAARVHVVELTGVGDRAMEISGPGTAGVYLNKGDALVVISVVIHTATSPPTGQAVALAKIAAGRL